MIQTPQVMLVLLISLHLMDIQLVVLELMEMEIMKGNVIHGGNRCLRWQFGCAIIYTDNNENKRVIKEQKENKKVDGVIASIIALNSYVQNRIDPDDDIVFDILTL